MSTLLLLTCTLALMAGCATGPTIITNANPQVNMAGFSTFNFMRPLSTDRDNGVRTPLSAMLMSAMTREMKLRGFQQSDSPDLLINFFVNVESRMWVRQSPRAMAPPSVFHNYRSARYRAWPGYETTIAQYERGTLSVDLVDPAGNVLVWEGVAMQRLQSPQVTQQQVDEVVAQVMARFPHRAK